jgi:hypothetical protein
MKITASIVGLVALGLAGCTASQASSAAHASQADLAPRYFVTMFGYEGEVLNRPATSHTFATFTVAQGESLATSSFWHIDISWLPAQLDSRLVVDLLGGAVPGHNWSLSQTLYMAETAVGPLGFARPRRLGKRGPYEISGALFDAAQERASFLNAGGANYIVEDVATRDPYALNTAGEAVNCIHAVSDAAGFLRTGLDYGFAASADILADWAQRGLIAQPADDASPILYDLGVSQIPSF